MLKLRNFLPVLVAVAALVAVGCGERTDVSQGVEELNSQVLSAQGAKIDCPKEVDGGEGTTFECTLTGSGGGEGTKVDLKIVKEGENLAVDIANEQEFRKALEQVTKQ